MREIVIDGHSIAPGEHRIIDLSVSKLPSDTTINIHAHVYRSDTDGPTVLLLGGIHGDEINGVEIVRRMIDGEELNNIQCGTVIAISLLNVYGFINSRRGVPDGKDVNRSFPGASRGSLASQVASCLTKKILPNVDITIDYHTGGDARYNYPQVRYSKDDQQAKELGKVFAPPFLIAKPRIPKSFRKTANEMGIAVLVYEAGESERLNGLAIESGMAGTLRVLRHLEMILAKDTPKPPKVIEVLSTGWIRANAAGMFIWSRQSGAEVQKGEVLGHIHSPQGDRTSKVLARKPGYIIGHNNASVVHEGDALFHIAYTYEETFA